MENQNWGESNHFPNPLTWWDEVIIVKNQLAIERWRGKRDRIKIQERGMNE